MTEKRSDASCVISDVNELAMAWAREHAGERLGTKWYDGEKSTEPSEKWPVSESVRLAIRQIVTEAFGRATSISELTESIRAASGFTKEQARIVAETEASFAMVRGNYEAWQKTGMVKSVEWTISTFLHTEVDECDLNAAAGAIPFGHPFPSGEIAPPQHPGCRCALALVELIEPKRKAVP